MNTLWQDLRFAVRMLWRSPGFTLVAVGTLALGIGVNAGVFSLVNAALLKPLPVDEPERLVSVFSGSRENPYSNSSYPDYIDYRDGTDVFSGLAAHSVISVSLNSGDQTELVFGSIVTGNYFDVLGVSAALGRTFLPEEDRTPGTHPVAILSHGLWQRRFGGDPHIVGKELLLNGETFAVVGVAPQGFNGVEAGRASDIYVPTMMQARVRPPRSGYSGEMNPDLLARRSSRWLYIVGRLKESVTIEQAQSQMTVIAKRLEQAYPEVNQAQIATVFPSAGGDPEQRGTLLSVAGLLTAVVGLVLLIACGNVANLLLARATARRKEISIRLALGASRARLVRQLLTESVLLSLAGGALGLLLAWWMVDAMRAYPPPANLFPFQFDIDLDGRVLGYTLLISVLTGVVFGLAPALATSNPDLVHALKDETATLTNKNSRGVRGLNLRNSLVVAQVASSLVLLIGAGLFLQSLWRAQRIDPGFDPENVITMPLNVDLLRYTKPQGREFYRRVIERIEAVPGVRSATFARMTPLSGARRQSDVMIEGRDDATAGNNGEGQGANRSQTLAGAIGLRYFETLNIPLLRGRDFSLQDREGAPHVVIINETFAKRFFPDQDPLGKRLSLNGADGPWQEVVGVARNGKYVTLGEAPAPFVYQSLLQRHETGVGLLVRTDGNPANLVATVRGEVQSIEKNLPITNVRLMTELLGNSLFAARTGALLLLVFGLLALMLAAIGLYGVMSYAVARRTREIGVRMALGANRGDVLRLVLRESMTLVGAGIMLGLIGAFALTRLLTSFLYGVSTTDSSTFVGVSLFLAATALLASFIPARRATKIDPMVALRYE